MNERFGAQTLGRLFNVLGEAIDGKEALKNPENANPIHRDFPSFREQLPISTILETGLKVIDLLAPSILGYIGIPANHAPLVSLLISGTIIVRDSAGKTAVFNCAGKGFLEVLANKVTILLN